MLHEKPNDPFHWKNKLDELDHLPGETALDKNGSWEKLHGRLGKNSRVKRIGWYWLAAASVLIAMGVRWIIVNQQENKIITKTQNIVAPKEPIKSEILNDKISPALSTPIAFTQGTRRVVPPSSRKQRRQAIPNAIESKITVVKDSSISLPEINVKSSIVENTLFITTVTTAPVKKKLRIIHINELGKTAEEEMQYARTSPPAFRTRSIHQENPSGLSFSRNASDNVIKIKLSPSN